MAKNCLEWNLQLTTDANDSISRVSRMTRAVKGSFGVGAVGIGVTVVGEMKILFWFLIGQTLVKIWNDQGK